MIVGRRENSNKSTSANKNKKIKNDIVWVMKITCGAVKNNPIRLNSGSGSRLAIGYSSKVSESNESIQCKKKHS